MGFEAMFKRFAPYLVGWYAIASITDAMFYSMTGLTFFVGSWYVRAGLTVADLVAAYAVWYFVKRSDEEKARQTFSLYEEAARAVNYYINFTCKPTVATDPDHLFYDRERHKQYMNVLQQSSGQLYADVFTQELQKMVNQRAISQSSTVSTQSLTGSL